MLDTNQKLSLEQIERKILKEPFKYTECAARIEGKVANFMHTGQFEVNSNKKYNQSQMASLPNDQRKAIIKTRKSKILIAMSETRWMTCGEIAKACSMQSDAVSADLSTLRKAGLTKMVKLSIGNKHIRVNFD